MNVTYIALAILVVIYLVIPLTLYWLTPRPWTTEDLQKRRRAIVLVLGDLGRSPRMNYHALSLAQGGLEVDLCGYTDTPLLEEVKNHKLINIHSIPTISNTKNLPFVLFGPWKVILQHYYLYKTLKPLKDAWYMIVQNPPSLPTLGVVKFFIIFVSSRTKLIIDWHNLGYSILGMKLGDSHPFVRIYRLYERFLGARAWVHLTVTVGLGQFLRQEFKMNGRRIIPLFDRPAYLFKPLSSDARQFLVDKHSLFKDRVEGEKIVVTSTSYTPDENLSLFLDALELYANSQAAKNPFLRVIITGKGPMYQEMQDRIDKLQPLIEHKVKIITAWLPQEDYPRIIGTADIGVSLHESSSGWDLPMKIVDLFGVGVPAISVNFPAIIELVKQDENGVILEKNTKEEMARVLSDTLTRPGYLEKLKTGAMTESRNTWEVNWNRVLGPLFGIGEYAQSSRLKNQEELSSSDEEDGAI